MLIDHINSRKDILDDTKITTAVIDSDIYIPLFNSDKTCLLENTVINKIITLWVYRELTIIKNPNIKEETQTKINQTKCYLDKEVKEKRLYIWELTLDDLVEVSSIKTSKPYLGLGEITSFVVASRLNSYFASNDRKALDYAKEKQMVNLIDIPLIVIKAFILNIIGESDINILEQELNKHHKLPNEFGKTCICIKFTSQSL